MKENPEENAIKYLDIKCICIKCMFAIITRNFIKALNSTLLADGLEDD